MSEIPIIAIVSSMGIVTCRYNHVQHTHSTCTAIVFPNVVDSSQIKIGGLHRGIWKVGRGRVCLMTLILA